MPDAELNRAALQQHLTRREIWSRKYVIRACYRGWYERLKPFIVPGHSVEVGAGSCGLSEFWPDLWTTDVVPGPFIDFASDAARLPFADNSLSNLVCIDLLHHLRDPHELLDDATRALRPGGHLLAIEPYITPISYVGYRMMHHEDVWFDSYQKPEGDHSAKEKDDPWQGNLAMANILFSREAKNWPARHPSLRFVAMRKFGLFDFQLAGGFKPYAFVKRPGPYHMFQALDRALDCLGPLVGFRVFCVLERIAS